MSAIANLRRPRSRRRAANSLLALAMGALLLGGCAAGSMSLPGLGILRSAPAADATRPQPARYVLSQLRAHQSPGSDGFRALTASMAILALRDGDLAAFRQLAGELDAALPDRVRVDGAWVEVVAVYRHITGANLPVNTPPNLRDYLRRARAPSSNASFHVSESN